MNMSTLSVPLRLPTPRNDYLRIALVLSLAIHAAALTVHFVSPPVPATKLTSLEVTLVNARSEADPIQPKILAQNPLNGGGEAVTGQAASPLPRTVAHSVDDIVLSASRKRQEGLGAETGRAQCRERVSQYV